MTNRLTNSEYFLAEFCDLKTNKIIDETFSGLLNSYMLNENKATAQDLFYAQCMSIDIKTDAETVR